MSSNNINNNNEDFCYDLAWDEYRTIAQRMETYEGQWQKPHIDILELSKAGFYFFQTYDKTRCFKCDLVLKEWEISNDPWREHAFWSPECQHVNEKKGRSYIVEVCKNWQSVRGY